MNLIGYSTITQSTRHPTRTTDSYRFISTREVLDTFSELGWFPTSVKEAGVRKEENRGYQKHLVRLENPEFSARELDVGDAFPQIVLRSSHCGETALSLNSGIMEKVCRNGLIVATGRTERVRIPHLGYAAWLVESAVNHIAEELPEAFRQRERWRGIRLELDAKLAFADAAVALRFDRRFTVEPQEVLTPRRAEQADSSLWSVFNTVQENIMRGGVRQKREDGTTFRTRAIQSVDAEIDINQALWQLAANLETALN
jgi:hypothetical protein